MELVDIWTYLLKCTAPDPAGGAYSAPPDLLAVFMGAYFEGREGE